MSLNHRVPGSSPRAHPSQAISQFMRGNRGFLARVSESVSASDESIFAGLSLRRKFPFPALTGDRFDACVVGHQFEPYCLHHPVSRARTLFALVALVAPQVINRQIRTF